ncbi:MULTISPECIES: lanthionine synthetase LanC family protein [unclassified Microbacterium]|uniref:lanthionine synthetase LanC family protein n=1 Tax=unclassified Microbacterium TaxID=2609290 RepID=UPI000EE1C53F|nr:MULTISPECIES: lanthionine synthetase LanC family protein [unclassified Microbacterium]MBT2486638.1 hypothetical protein [Microbacterium sp. ISL-108]RKN69323.1 hypothetical protein D7252_18235 [Microbacterium sp. CGR2]
MTLTNGLERLTIEPPQDMRPLSYAHGLAGTLSALASLAPADPALPQAARRIVELSYQTSGGPLKWVPSSWCAGHAGVSIAVLRTAIETDDTELLKLAWDLFRYGMDAGTPEKDPLSLCHGLGGSVAMAGAFANHMDNADADAMFRSLTTRLMVEVEQFEVKPDTNIELASGVTGALVALCLSNSAQAQRLVELLLGVPGRSVA